MDPKNSITTERLFLKQLSGQDKPFIFELLNTEGWIEYIGNRDINSLEDATTYIQKINDDPKTNYWTARLRENDRAIGVVTLIKRDYLDHHDLGFAFLPQFTNQGFALEATKAILNELISQKSISDILAVTLPGNTVSIKLIEKLGLKLDQTLEIDSKTLRIYKACAGEIKM
jgi:[ribosomal protein S5]-alanine N-acetyltransferase